MTQRSDAGEARTRNPSVSSLVLYHWDTELPTFQCYPMHLTIVTKPRLI